MKKLLTSATIIAGAMWFTPANAALVLGPDAATEGLIYSLTAATTADPKTDQFTLTITGENTASDTRGGRSGINAIAFGKPAQGVSGGQMIQPPNGWTFALGGLNSSGCDGSGNFFCFDNTNIPPTPGGLLSGTLTFVFNVSVPSGNWSSFTTTAFKIDWVGTQNNYSLVSEDIPVNTGPGCTVNCNPPPPVPEPASIALLGVGLLGLGFVSSRRRS